MKRYIFGAICVAVTAASFAQSPRQDFQSQKLLDEAKSEIQGFSRDQLEAFITYLADCESGDPGAAPCSRASTVLDVKTASATSLKQLRLSLFVIRKAFPWHKKMDAGDERTLDRMLELQSQLKSAAAKRYAAISQDH